MKLLIPPFPVVNFVNTRCKLSLSPCFLARGLVGDSDRFKDRSQLCATPESIPFPHSFAAPVDVRVILINLIRSTVKSTVDFVTYSWQCMLQKSTPKIFGQL
ncbi:hypothetical protein AVEN_71465-1 [Araneus ventricosus]|uniref:Uncharacterized protein n=1 Tax=Araneus ventricosus TaxID=182803 RepID=A0A4Y2CW10_ARAVE|nr:hypothetical protein AVEN_71465-1 [Araneus ventricosus]